MYSPSLPPQSGVQILSPPGTPEAPPPDRTPDESLLTEANDDFTRATNAALTAHTPTGANAAVGPWRRFSGTDNARVAEATDRAEDTASGASNRHSLEDDLGSESMDIYGEFESNAAASNVVFFGLGGLLDPFVTQDLTSQLGLTFIYGFNNNSWHLEDDIGGGVDELAEAWPGGIVPLFLRIRPGDASGWAKVGGVWVEKVQLATWTATGTRGGLILGNFSGSGTRSWCHAYRSRGI